MLLFVRVTLEDLEVRWLNFGLDVLENCGIAWPNPGMWWQGQQQFHNITSPRNETAEPEAHAHSPRRQGTSKSTTSAPANVGMAPPHMSQGLTAHPAFRARHEDPFWSQHGPMHDPFTGNANPTSFYKTVGTRNTTSSGDISMPDQSRSTSSSHDQPMADYHRSLSPASSRRSHPMPDYSRPPGLFSSRNTSNFETSAMTQLGLSSLESMLQSHQEPDDNGHFNDMMASFSPRNFSTSGISAPSNTRVSSAANTPPRASNQTLTAGDKDKIPTTSGHPRSVSVTTRDPPPPTIRVSMISAIPGQDAHEKGVFVAGPEKGTIIKKPVGRPKGRKEGKTNELEALSIATSKSQRRATTGSISAEGKENATDSTEKASDGKRKRSINVSEKIALQDRLASQDTSSPTRKFSKTGPGSSANYVDLDDLTAEGVVTRAPLGEVDNRM